MRNKSAILFSLLFCGILLVVPIVQLVKESIHGERLQVFDIFEDTFTTPFRRGRAIRDNLARCSDSLHVCEQLSEASDDGMLYQCAEEALVAGESVRRTFIEINRHISDSTRPALASFDTLVARLKNLCTAIDEGKNTAVKKGVVVAQNDIRLIINRYGGGNGLSALTNVVQAFFTGTFFNNRYLRAFENDLEERSLFVLSIRPVMQLVRYALLGDLGSKAIAGRNSWLFYRPGVEYLYRPSIYDPRSKSVDYNDKAVHDDPVEIIGDFKEQMAQRGIELLIVIVPGKASIYPDMVTKNIQPAGAGDISHTSDIIGRLRDRNIMVVDLFEPFIEERVNDSLLRDSLYLARDTHWRSRALRLAARQVARAVMQRPWYNDEHITCSYAIDSVDVERDGDVGVMTGLPNVHVRNLHCTFTPEVTKCYPVMHNYFDINGVITRQKPYQDDFRNARILVLGDSFSRIYQTDEPRGAGWIAHFAKELGEPMASIISDGGASTLVREKLARKPRLLHGKRIVVWEFVERDIRFGAFGWKKVALSEE